MSLSNPGSANKDKSNNFKIRTQSGVKLMSSQIRLDTEKDLSKRFFEDFKDDLLKMSQEYQTETKTELNEDKEKQKQMLYDSMKQDLFAIKKKFSGIFNSEYEETLRSFNEILDMERSLDSEALWSDQLGRLSGNYEQNQRYLESYKEILENEMKISKMEKILGKKVKENNGSFFITKNSKFYQELKKRQEKNDNDFYSKELNSEDTKQLIQSIVNESNEENYIVNKESDVQDHEGIMPDLPHNLTLPKDPFLQKQFLERFCHTRLNELDQRIKELDQQEDIKDSCLEQQIYEFQQQSKELENILNKAQNIVQENNQDNEFQTRIDLLKQENEKMEQIINSQQNQEEIQEIETLRQIAQEFLDQCNKIQQLQQRIENMNDIEITFET